MSQNGNYLVYSKEAPSLGQLVATAPITHGSTRQPLVEGFDFFLLLLPNKPLNSFNALARVHLEASYDQVIIAIGVILRRSHAC